MRTLWAHCCGQTISSSQVAAGRGFYSYNGTVAVASDLGRGGNTPVISIGNATADQFNKVTARSINTYTDDIYVAWRISRSSGTPNTNSFYPFKITNWGGNLIVGLLGTGAGNGSLTLVYAGGTVALSSAVTMNTTQQFVEIYCKPLSSNGILIMRVDGAEVYSATNLSFASFYMKPCLVHWSNTYSLVHYLQDPIIRDTNGGSLEWLGPLAFVHADLPNGDGAQTDFTADGGGSHYVNVDDTISNDATDKNRSVTVGNIELYTFPSLPSNIEVVHAVGIAATGNPVTANAGYYLEGRSRSSGGTQYAFGESKLGPATWQSNCLGFMDNNPATGVPWASKSAAEAYQLGVKHAVA